MIALHVYNFVKIKMFHKRFRLYIKYSFDSKYIKFQANLLYKGRL